LLDLNQWLNPNHLCGRTALKSKINLKVMGTTNAIQYQQK